MATVSGIGFVVAICFDELTTFLAKQQSSFDYENAR
jgi:hypothetical protein